MNLAGGSPRTVNSCVCSARCQAATSSVRLITLHANNHPNYGNGELHKAKGRTFLTMDQAGETRIAGLWWGCTIFMHCWPESRACSQVEGFISRTYIKQKQSHRKLFWQWDWKWLFFYLWINREFMLNCLGACSGVYALKTKALSAIFCGSNVSSARHRWDAPPSPLPTAGHALRKWEQSCEGAGNRRKLLAGLYQYNDIKQSGLCSAMQFLSCSFTLPGVWALCTQPEAFPQGRSWSAQLLGLLPADPWPWEACGPWWEQGSAPPTSWLSSSRANIQPDTEHAICRNTNLLLLKLLDFSLKTNKRMRKRAISRANGTHWFCICDLP